MLTARGPGRVLAVCASAWGEPMVRTPDHGPELVARMVRTSPGRCDGGARRGHAGVAHRGCCGRSRGLLDAHSGRRSLRPNPTDGVAAVSHGRLNRERLRQAFKLASRPRIRARNVKARAGRERWGPQRIAGVIEIGRRFTAGHESGHDAMTIPAGLVVASSHPRR
jgi:hypothetical protein